MEPWMRWILCFAIGGALYWYYSHNNKNRGRHRGRSLQRAPIPAKADSAMQWSDAEATPKPTSRSAKAKPPRKSVKKVVREVGDKTEAYLSAASSTAGADADDDLSPAMSPALGATNLQAPSGKDVSDMLEPHGAAPAVLKINPSEKPSRPSKPQQQRAESLQETKKQRQNKRKAEEAKAQREADEKQRQILLEKQRRTAREARGEAARNGLQAAQAPTSNPWTAVRSSSRTGAAPGGHDGQLLDTFDPEVGSTASSSEIATNGTSATTDSLSNSTHWTNLPSEEEQLRMAMEDSAWTTVPKGKKQRKNKAAGSTTGEEGSDSGIPQEPAPVKKAPAPVSKVENVKPQSRFGLLAEPDADATASHPMDSDWPVV
ncbi:uncharacterized protein BDR25DRAFT_114341 [Lindgomyces ingoldianus]|uniref:Uncharacterized protein n=1 Tax=Lindgomyces ingoldianus TaxID=673940 RepID=A0ACB6Q8W3_9PLEO|nr:uncharacterized protein BDR25DRAFT_114341 [Lindgomyces ingoldianus]KAF2463369.1 hypothetical protein BDR25DRAFT_114341 [Lindgomyces ingoldianus]